MIVTLMTSDAALGSFSCNRVEALDHGFDITVKDTFEREHAHALLVNNGCDATQYRDEPEEIVVTDLGDCWLRFE